MYNVRRIDKKSEEWVTFEILHSSRSIHIFKSKCRTSVHVDVKGTGKRLVFIAKDNGVFYHYMEDFSFPGACQGAPIYTYDYVWTRNFYLVLNWMK